MNLKMMKLGISLLAIPVLMLAIPLHLSAKAAPADWTGTWKFNPEKSKFPGKPPLADQVTIAPDGAITVEETDPNGTSRTWSYKPEQGKSVPVEGHGENVTVTSTKVNPHKTEQVWNFNGKAARSYAILSKDGKIQTFHISMTDKAGKPIHEIVVFEKQ